MRAHYVFHSGAFDVAHASIAHDQTHPLAHASGAHDVALPPRALGTAHVIVPHDDAHLLSDGAGAHEIAHGGRLRHSPVRSEAHLRSRRSSLARVDRLPMQTGTFESVVQHGELRARQRTQLVVRVEGARSPGRAL